VQFRILVLALATLSPAPSFATPAATEAFCARDLSSTDSRLRQTLTRLNESRSAPMGERCEIFRRHVQVMQQAAAVFDRCTSGRSRQENVGQMLGSIADWRDIIARNCR
jgi:hypothetical protein